VLSHEYLRLNPNYLTKTEDVMCLVAIIQTACGPGAFGNLAGSRSYLTTDAVSLEKPIFRSISLASGVKTPNHRRHFDIGDKC